MVSSRRIEHIITRRQGASVDQGESFTTWPIYNDTYIKPVRPPISIIIARISIDRMNHMSNQGSRT